jgi:stearoyl-CoA desaturase (delta-9 desaturase)
MLVVEQAPPPAPSRAPAPPERAPAAFRWQQALTGLIVLAPITALVWALANVWHHPPSALDLGLAAAMYLVTGHGVTVGFHRLFTHRSFRATRPLKVALAVAGSMAFQGPLVGWVADHRRHHVFTDVSGDPHSPHDHRPGVVGVVRGALHAHAGWLFQHDPTETDRYARDIARDPDLRRISALFPLWCVVSLGLPFVLGGLIGGSLGTAGSALLWAGLVRVAVLHEVTWSINSICHLVGRRPYDTPDRSTNVALLSVVSMGESFHNTHHAFPRSARHGLDRGQLDSSAALIGLLRRLGWADEVRVGPRV